MSVRPTDLRGNGVKVWFDMPFEEYTALKGVNSSRLKHLDHSPQAFLDNPQTISKRSASIGHLVHCMMLEPEEVNKRYVASPEGLRRDKRTKAYKEFLATVPEGAESVSLTDFELAGDIVEAAENDPLVAEVMNGTMNEVTVQWVDEESGVLCKCRWDACHKERGLIDVKTTRDCTPRGFQWEAKKYGYWMQAAHYDAGRRAVQRAGLMKFDSSSYRIVAVDNQATENRYSVVYVLDKEVIEAFNEERVEKLHLVQSCKEKKEWPGPGMGTEHMLTFPGTRTGTTETATIDEIGLDFG